MIENHLFHVHTYRCGHASNESEEEYIKKAINYGVKKITFTDHAPFPGDPFNMRMRFSELPEYISSLKELKNSYRGSIEVVIGLEIEYLPSYKEYYKELKTNSDIEILMLGQHHFELCDGSWSFEHDVSDCGIEFLESQIAAIKTDLFDVIAHPDRCIKYSKDGWTEDIKIFSEKLIKECNNHQVSLEKNLSSMRGDKLYWPEFWSLVPEHSEIIIGCDAHSTGELIVSNKIIKNRSKRI